MEKNPSLFDLNLKLFSIIKADLQLPLNTMFQLTDKFSL